MTKANDDICPVCGRFTIDCGQPSCFEKERLMRTPTKSDEVREFQFPDYTSSSEYEEIYHAYQDLLAKCAKYEAALKKVMQYSEPHFTDYQICRDALAKEALE